MKDKEKQIEEKLEMARIIAFDLCPSGKQHNGLYREPLCYSNDNFGDCSKIKNVVDNLYNAGYRKIPEDSVVLSREEYEKKKKHLQNVLELSSFQLENVVKENEKLKEQLKDKKLLTEENYNKLCHLAYFGYDDAYEKGSKKTAEKFLQLAYDRCLEKSFIKKVEELAKQFGVEIKE